MKRSPIARSRQFQPSPSCFMCRLSVRMLVRFGALAQLVGPAAIGTLDPPLGAEIEVDFGMPQRATAAVTGYAVGVDGDDFERLGHDFWSPRTSADDSRRALPGHARRVLADRRSGGREGRGAAPCGRQ